MKNRKGLLQQRVQKGGGYGQLICSQKAPETTLKNAVPFLHVLYEGSTLRKTVVPNVGHEALAGRLRR